MLAAAAFAIAANGPSWATDDQSGFFSMGAMPLVAGSASAGVGAGGVWAVAIDSGPEGTTFPAASVAPGAEGTLAFTDRVAARASAVAEIPWGGRVVSALSVRWMLVDRDAIRLAPVATVIAALPPETYQWAAGFGFAVEGGWERVRMDLGMQPLFALRMQSEPGPRSPARVYFGPPEDVLDTTFDVGISFLTQARNRWRIGPPGVSYHLRKERFYLDVGGLTYLIAGVAVVKAGSRW